MPGLWKGQKTLPGAIPPTGQAWFSACSARNTAGRVVSGFWASCSSALAARGAMDLVSRAVGLLRCWQEDCTPEESPQGQGQLAAPESRAHALGEEEDRPVPPVRGLRPRGSPGVQGSGVWACSWGVREVLGDSNTSWGHTEGDRTRPPHACPWWLSEQVCSRTGCEAAAAAGEERRAELVCPLWATAGPPPLWGNTDVAEGQHHEVWVTLGRRHQGGCESRPGASEEQPLRAAGHWPLCEGLRAVAGRGSSASAALWQDRGRACSDSKKRTDELWEQL